MAMKHSTKKLLALLILLVGLPLYAAAALYSISLWTDAFGRPNLWVELVIYVVLGLVWALPFRSIFRGVGQPGPGEPPIDKR
ncbi:MAG: DUF2842 domain-containing protein [Pseudomonadota bacterium]